MDLREGIVLAFGSEDGLLHDVPDAGRLRRLDGGDLELRLVLDGRPEEEQRVAALERRPQGRWASVVDHGSVDPLGPRRLRLGLREEGRPEWDPRGPELPDELAPEGSA